VSEQANIILQGTVIGVPFAGGGIGPWSISTVTPMGFAWQNPLALGTNTVAVPVITGVTPTVIIVVPPIGNTTSILYKTVVGDTGIYINPGLPSMHAIDPAHIPTSIYLVAGSAITGQTSVLII
jgi:hypothetical protein